MWRARHRHREAKTRIFFATDIHGSERCFRKWLNAREAYRADVLILGGDITGKALVPIVEAAPDVWTAEVRGEVRRADSVEELDRLRNAIQLSGYYTTIVQPDEKDELDADPTLRDERFREVMRDSLERWVALADHRIPEGFPAYAMLGNDDYPDLAGVLRGSRRVKDGEAQLWELPGGQELLSCGYSNPTPWDSPRELAEPDLAARLEKLAEGLACTERAIFNLHCPPRDTHLDQAPRIDSDFKPRAGMAGGVELASVGSAAVRDLIERFQPMVGLHGHVHECSAADHVGRTLCINPGSNYLTGTLRGALLELNGAGEVRGWQMTEG
jgi:Icc-related predicted phosphoesterase